MRRILQEGVFPLRCVRFTDSIGYDHLMAVAVCRGLGREAEERLRATILIDGLQKARIQALGKHLRRMGANVKKIRGVRDESDALVRLADAFAGLERLAMRDWDSEAKGLFAEGVRLGVIENLTP